MKRREFLKASGLLALSGMSAGAFAGEGGYRFKDDPSVQFMNYEDEEKKRRLFQMQKRWYARLRTTTDINMALPKGAMKPYGMIHFHWSIDPGAMDENFAVIDMAMDVGAPRCNSFGFVSANPLLSDLFKDLWHQMAFFHHPTMTHRWEILRNLFENREGIYAALDRQTGGPRQLYDVLMNVFGRHRFEDEIVLKRVVKDKGKGWAALYAKAIRQGAPDALIEPALGRVRITVPAGEILIRYENRDRIYKALEKNADVCGKTMAKIEFYDD